MFDQRRNLSASVRTAIQQRLVTQGARVVDVRVVRRARAPLREPQHNVAKAPLGLPTPHRVAPKMQRRPTPPRQNSQRRKPSRDVVRAVVVVVAGLNRKPNPVKNHVLLKTMLRKTDEQAKNESERSTVAAPIAAAAGHDKIAPSPQSNDLRQPDTQAPPAGPSMAPQEDRTPVQLESERKTELVQVETRTPADTNK